MTRMASHAGSSSNLRSTPSAAADGALRGRLLELLQDAAPPPPVTYEEFLAWADEDVLAEWVDGEVIMSSPASLQHQNILHFLTRLIGAYVETRELGIVLSAPFQMKLERSGREPDLLFIAREHVDRLHANYLDGPADLVAEIISPESAGRDRGDKFYEYAQGGVPEYWLLDPHRRWGEFYRLDEGHYRLSFADGRGEFPSQVLPGFRLRVEWLWQDQLPPVEDVLLEIGGEAYARRLIERLRRRGFLPPTGETDAGGREHSA